MVSFGVKGIVLLLTMVMQGGRSSIVQHRSLRPNDRALQARLANILHNNIITWWLQYAPDQQYGGYKLHHTDNNTYLGPNDKYIVTQARVIWFFSLLYSYPEYRQESYRDMAELGFSFIRDHMWDNDYGGFFMSVSHKGERVTNLEDSWQGDFYKNLYGQAFGLYCLSKYYISFNDKEALNMAGTLFDRLMEHAYDSTYGGFMEVVYRNWTLADVGGRGTKKTINTQLHLLEAVTAYYKATQDLRAKAVLEEMLLPLTTRAIDSTKGFVPEMLERDWSPSPLSNNTISFGHVNELTWLIIETCEALGIPPETYSRVYRRLYGFSTAHGYDKVQGAFNYMTSTNLSVAIADEKVWWTQCESLLASIKLRRVLKSREAGDIFVSLIDYLEGVLIDWDYGEWHWKILDGEPGGLKAEPWKGPYHNGRAMVLSIEELYRQSSLST